MNNRPSMRRTGKKDDLTVIKGIREVRQRVLRQALAVHTYDDLANVSSEHVIAAFKAAGQSVSRANVESWIAEARRLATTQSQAHAKQTNPRSADTQSVALFFLEFLTPQELGGSPTYSTRLHYMERDWDEVIDGVDPILIWSRISEALYEEAPHLSRSLMAAVEDHMAAQAGEALPIAQSQQAQAAVDSPPEKRLRDVLSEVERMVGSPVGAGTFQSATALTPAEQTERTTPPAAAATTKAPAKTGAPSDIEAADARLRYYLQKYGMGVEEARGPKSQPQQRRAETTVKPTDNIEQVKLARYIAKYGRV